MNTPAELMDRIERSVNSLRESRLQTGDLYPPMDYILALGGKRIRPLLFLLGYQCVKGSAPDTAVDAALSVELFHNFSLLHDDIMDNAPLRRGKTTVHEKWDVNTAILAGDAMFAMAFEFLIKGHEGQAAPLLKEFTRVSIGVCEGQMEDMAMAHQLQATIPQYIEMIRKKTAMLIGGSLSLGAIAAGAEPEVVRAFYAYGESAGIGFQLHDDYLDVYAGSAKSGKQVAGDILENKKTYLLLRCFEKADDTQKSLLLHYLLGQHAPEAKIQGVKELYDELGIPADTQGKMDHYFAQADSYGEKLHHLPGFGHVQAFMMALRQRDH